MSYHIKIFTPILNPQTLLLSHCFSFQTKPNPTQPKHSPVPFLTHRIHSSTSAPLANAPMHPLTHRSLASLSLSFRMLRAERTVFFLYRSVVFGVR